MASESFGELLKAHAAKRAEHAKAMERVREIEADLSSMLVRMKDAADDEGLSSLFAEAKPAKGKGGRGRRGAMSEVIQELFKPGKTVTVEEVKQAAIAKGLKPGTVGVALVKLKKDKVLKSTSRGKYQLAR